MNNASSQNRLSLIDLKLKLTSDSKLIYPVYMKLSFIAIVDSNVIYAYTM